MYNDRSKAGEVLADLLDSYKMENLTILAIPNGGVPVAVPIFKRFRKINPSVEFQLLIVRKMPIPFNTEAGFGAITLDGTVILNKVLVARIGLSEDQIQTQATMVLKQMKARLKTYGLETQKFELKGKTVIIIDDGLASGFTMLAAIKSIQKYTPEKIIIAIPTAPRSSVTRVSPLVDAVICPNIRDTLYFAVAEAYKHWYDLEFDEVQMILKEIQTL